MQSGYSFRPAVPGDAEAIARIFNVFVRDSFAAYPTVEVDNGFFGRLAEAAEGLPFYVVESPAGQVVGFGCLREYHPADTLRGTVEITYFLLPEYTRKGIGQALLERLETVGRASGVRVILASISSRNEQSIAFHRKNGFVECGRFARVGNKFGQDFDDVWMQKFI